MFVMLQKLLHIDSVVKVYKYTFTLALLPSKLRFFFRSRADYSENSSDPAALGVSADLLGCCRPCNPLNLASLDWNSH